MSHTYAILVVSRAAFAEIAEKLRAAGYDHAFHDDLIDMHGLAVRAEPVEPPPAEWSGGFQ